MNSFFKLLAAFIGFTWCVTCGVAVAEMPSEPPAGKPKLLIGTMAVDRVLFLGNSITLHGPAPHIGWNGNWGMAASAADKDYVHILMNDIGAAAHGTPEMKIANIADFERQHDKYDVEGNLKQHVEFGADLIVIAIGENVPALTSDASRDSYRNAFKRLLSVLKSKGRPVIVVRSMFWPDPVRDGIMKEAAAEAGSVFVDITDVGREPSHAASSERSFQHAGVAAHPGDKGMRAIAKAIWRAIETESRVDTSSGR